ncbi:MAG: hypothetical protein HYX63_13300 [Gammaproteobacteria bacterium]|nr:hypothetical protein [Gammaproteobacteria bacterium]
MTILNQLSSGQTQKEVTTNNNFQVVSIAGTFAQNVSTTSGLTWGFFGGQIIVDGVFTAVADGTLALTASATNFIEVTRAGTVSANTTGFTAGRIALYEVGTNATIITSITDRRAQLYQFAGRPTPISVTTADVTLSAAQARCQGIETSGALTGNRNLILPAQVGIFYIANGCTGAFTLTAKASSGTGVIIGQKMRQAIYFDGTNYQPLISDPIVQNLAYAATVTPDASLGERVNIGALTAAITIGAPTNPTLGAKLSFTFLQNATGGFGITWNAVFKKAADPAAGGAATVASTEFQYNGANWVQQGGALAWF